MNAERYSELFRAEARERLTEMNNALLAIERGAGPGRVSELFRAVHNMKGMSAAMGYQSIRDLSHALETLLEKMRREETMPSPAVIDALFDAVDALAQEPCADFVADGEIVECSRTQHPELFALAMGALVGAVQQGMDLAAPLMFVGITFVLVQVLTPVQTAVSHNLGDKTAAYLYDRLTAACVRPGGIGHLENPALATDLTVARDFDRGMTGPPLSFSMDFIAGGLVGMIGGLAAALVLFKFTWWAPLLLAGAWLATHWSRPKSPWRWCCSSGLRAR